MTTQGPRKGTEHTILVGSFSSAERFQGCDCSVQVSCLGWGLTPRSNHEMGSKQMNKKSTNKHKHTKNKNATRKQIVLAKKAKYSEEAKGRIGQRLRTQSEDLGSLIFATEQG